MQEPARIAEAGFLRPSGRRTSITKYIPELRAVTTEVSCLFLMHVGRMKMRDWNYRHQPAGVENAGPSSYGKPNTYLLRHTQHDLSNFLLVFCCIILCKSHLILRQCCGLQ